MGVASATTDHARKGQIRERLAEMRQRTHDLVAPLSDADLVKVHEPTMGPVNWDLGHIPYFEEFWLVHGIHGSEEQLRHYDDTYDAEKQPRPTRDQLGLPERKRIERTMLEKRALVLAELDALDISSGPRLTREGFLHENIIQHEAQHQENMLIVMQMVPEGRYVPGIRLEKPRPRVTVEGMARVAAGDFILGSDQTVGIYDNEAPAHEVDLPAFEIDRAPVSNEQFLAFIESGGYQEERFWSEDGWDMRTVHKWRAPKFWSRADDGVWARREFDRSVPLALDHPVIHVSWYEADAYANWAGKRLPTEAEWEKAATWDPATRTKRRCTWGNDAWTPERANLDQRLFGTAPIGAYPDGASAYGCHQMMGDAWEWTSSDLSAYPGFRAFPYDEYSVPFFDRGFKVLRGGSWATRHHAARGTFRNWHQQDHQQIFAGFRLAKEA